MTTQIPFVQQYRYHLIGGGILLAAAVGAGIYHLRKKKKSRKSYATFSPAPSPRSSASSSGSGFCKSRSYPLGMGNCHPDVKLLQRGLKAMGADLGDYGPNKDGVDGKFGKMTLKALRSKFGQDSVTQADMARVKAMLQKWGG